ncbi:hypothetical protein SELMODRAFT_404469 [Selaginella moellendorffii]|uniref:Uncharacterized protein n=1 Tax=Selaginella moellendorffii TaxID=88036 RepID=D8QVF3_SELML|nr:hypothetical protein SELMODRAFT_431917 [Selaginella moellendorffii]EFJ36047.1 hypothetical protein SELMODRAFT_404469 [Selaginella moellendorffii]
MWSSSTLRRLASSISTAKALAHSSHSPRYVTPAAQRSPSSPPTPWSWSYSQQRFFAAVRTTKRYRTQRSKKKAKPAGPRRLVPAPSLHTKPASFVRREGRLTVHERKHEEFKQVLSRLDIKQFAWKSGDESGKSRERMELRKAADNVNPFECIPTFRKKSDCGPPPIAMKKRKGAVTISAVTFEERTRGAGKIKSIKDQKKRLLNFKRPRRPAQLKTDKRDED